jgi:hypothetical protein
MKSSKDTNKIEKKEKGNKNLRREWKETSFR